MIYHCVVKVQHYPYYGDPDILVQNFLIDATDITAAENTIYKFYVSQSSEEGERFDILSIDFANNLNSADFL